MARKKNKSMKWQVEEVLLAKLCIGQSKHEAKKKAREELKRKNENSLNYKVSPRAELKS